MGGERPAGQRGEVSLGWLRSRLTFSFGHYHDPAWMGFGPLRVINDDRVAPGGGFAPHRHANMEIISVVLDGALAQQEGGGERQRRQQGEREQHQTEAVGQALLLGAAALGFAAAKQNDGAHGAGLACQVTG